MTRDAFLSFASSCRSSACIATFRSVVSIYTAHKAPAQNGALTRLLDCAGGALAPQDAVCELFQRDLHQTQANKGVGRVSEITMNKPSVLVARGCKRQTG